MASKRRDKGEGTVYQRKVDGLWMARYKPEGSSKIKYLSGKTEQEVKRKLKAFKKESRKNEFVEIQKTTVQGYMDTWFYNVKVNDLKPKSFDRMESTLQNQVYPHIGDIQIASLTSNDIQSMINALVVEKNHTLQSKRFMMPLTPASNWGLSRATL